MTSIQLILKYCAFTQHPNHSASEQLAALFTTAAAVETIGHVLFDWLEKHSWLCLTNWTITSWDEGGENPLALVQTMFSTEGFESIAQPLEDLSNAQQSVWPTKNCSTLHCLCVRNSSLSLSFFFYHLSCFLHIFPVKSGKLVQTLANLLISCFFFSLLSVLCLSSVSPRVCADCKQLFQWLFRTAVHCT